MTRLLISVRNAEEARAALEGGADLIDIKEPSRGPLGAADAETWADVLRAVGGQRSVSAAMGELAGGPAPLAAGLAAQLRYVKLGLAGCAEWGDWATRWRAALAPLLPSGKAVAVAYADYAAAAAPSPDDVLHYALQFGCQTLLLDTYRKTGGDLFAWMGAPQLRRLMQVARAGGMAVVLAGALSARSIPRAQRFAPDYIAVRGAVCRGGRDGAVDVRRVRRLAQTLKRPAAGPWFAA